MWNNKKGWAMKKKKNCYLLFMFLAFPWWEFLPSLINILIINLLNHFSFLKKNNNFAKLRAIYLICMATIFNYRQLPKGTFRLTVTWVNVLQWNHIHSLEEAMLHCVCGFLSREILIELLMMWWEWEQGHQMQYQP